MTASFKPDVLLIEVHMRRSEGLPTVLRIIEEFPDTNVAVLTSSEDDSDVLAAGKLGIKGYLLKNSSLDDLVRAIMALSQGGAYISPAVCSPECCKSSLTWPAAVTCKRPRVLMPTEREKTSFDWLREVPPTVTSLMNWSLPRTPSKSTYGTYSTSCNYATGSRPQHMPSRKV